MSNPLIEQIILLLIDTLSDITTDNGYNQTVGTVHRPKTLQARGQVSYKSFDMVITLGETVPNEELDAMGNPPVIGITQLLQLDMIYRPSKATDQAIEAVLERFEADVRRTVMQDPQFNALAIDSDMDEPEWWANDDEAMVGATVMLNVHYRMYENDPYNVVGTPAAYQYIFDGGYPDTELYDDVIDAGGV